MIVAIVDELAPALVARNSIGHGLLRGKQDERGASIWMRMSPDW
jgi:hypothetical protein